MATGNEQHGDAADSIGKLWLVDANGVATLLRDFGRHLEGVVVIPNDPSRYGPIAGRILVGDEDRLTLASGEQLNSDVNGSGAGCQIYAVAPNGNYFTLSTSASADYRLPVALYPEDLDLVSKNAALFGINFSGGRVLTAPASDFANVCGEALVTTEFPGGSNYRTPAPGVSGLNLLRWNGTT